MCVCKSIFCFTEVFVIFQASSAYWRGNRDRESLQRVYGISYPDSKRLKVISFLALFLYVWFISSLC